MQRRSVLREIGCEKPRNVGFVHRFSNDDARLPPAMAACQVANTIGLVLVVSTEACEARIAPFVQHADRPSLQVGHEVLRKAALAAATRDRFQTISVGLRGVVFTRRAQRIDFALLQRLRANRAIA